MRIITVMLLCGLSAFAVAANQTQHSNGISVDGMHKRKYQCPANFVRLANSCYYLSVYMETWRNAQFTCQDMNGSQLATPDRKWKDKRLRELLNMEMATRLERWIGGIFDWGRNQWVWGMTGQRMKYQGFSVRTKGDNEWHCIAMDPVYLYRWKSESCVKRKHFICELPLRNIGAKPTDIIRKQRKGNQKRKGKKRKMNKESNNIL